MTDCVLTRVSTREFKESGLSDSEIEQLVAAFQAAPCGMHQTDVMQGLIIKNKQIIKEINTATNGGVYSAPILFLINTKRTSEFGTRDASVAAENIMIEANSLKLGSVYVMSAAQQINKNQKLKEKLGITDEYECQVVVCVGYPAKIKKIADRKNRYQIKIV